LSEIGAVITQNILPILLVASFGYALRRWRSVDPRPLSSAAINVLSPALVFSSLVNSRIPGGELLELTLFAILVIAAMGLLGFAAAKLLHLSRLETAALLIVVMFANSGNFGLTLVNLRYGEEGLARAVVYYTTGTMLIYTLGVFIASMGQVSWRGALGRTMRMPAVYAAIFAIPIYAFNVPVPKPLMSAIDITAAGAIPVMLLVLGMQMAELRSGLNLRMALPAVSLRLLAGPLVGVLVAGLLGLQGLGRSASIIEASMPTAVFTIILATEFNLPVPAVTSIVVLGTLLSPLTVALVISLFGL
jgi:predicted permease